MPAEPKTTEQPTNRAHAREVLALAVPAFATLVSEPLLVLADSAIIGHLATSALAGLGIAANVLGIIVGLCIFLAYGTTATVARRLGAGDKKGALAGGLDGMTLGLMLGIVLGAALAILAPLIVGWYDPGSEVAWNAARYLSISAAGIPAVLVMLASTGVLRGLQDTRTPLYVAVAANLVNIGLNFSLVYGANLGIAGSAIGTVIVQYASAAVLAAVVLRGARREEVHWRWHPAGVVIAARSGLWLMLRTLSLQISITITTLTAASMGAIAMAGHQVVNSLWVLLALGLDAIAIAAQAIIGRYLGGGRVNTVKALTRLMVKWGVLGGVAFGLIVAVASPVYGRLFTPDPEVRTLLTKVLIVVAVITPIAGVVYVLDGVLIGAGDARYLALAGLIAMVCYLPLAWLVRANGVGLVWLWTAYCGYMIARMITLLWRIRGTAWQRVGA